MKSNYRGILAVVLSMGVLFVWYKWIAPPVPTPSSAAPTAVETTMAPASTAVPAAKTPSAGAETDTKIPGEEVTLQSDLA